MAVSSGGASSARKPRQYLFGVARRAGMVYDMRYFALLVDDEGDPIGKAHHRLRDPEDAPAADRPVRPGDRAIGVGKQRKSQAIGFGEALVGSSVLRRDAEDPGALCAYFRVVVAQGTGLRGAPRREIHRVEVKHQFRAAKIGKTDLASIGGHAAEIRRRVARSRSHRYSCTMPVRTIYASRSR